MSFDNTLFLEKSYFADARFSSRVDFSHAKFSQKLTFDRCKFQNATEFSGAFFGEDASFRAIESESAFSLAQASFKRVPDFIQGRFSEAPRLDDIDLPSNIELGGFWRTLLRIFKADNDAIGSFGSLSARYRALKRLAIQGHDHDREQIFFKGELLSRRGVEDRFFSWRLWLGVLYQVLSDFGRSFFRPLFWWSVTTAWFATYYLGKHSAVADPPYPAGIVSWLWQALRASVANWLPRDVPGWLPGAGWLSEYLSGIAWHAPPPLTCLTGQSEPLVSVLLLSIKKGLLIFGFDPTEKVNQTYACLYGLDKGYTDMKPGNEALPIIPDSVAFAGIGQTLISAVLIFLFLLAIRNHFRIK